MEKPVDPVDDSALQLFLDQLRASAKALGVTMGASIGSDGLPAIVVQRGTAERVAEGVSCGTK